MRKIVAIMAMAVVGGVVMAQEPLRVLSYNIRNCRGMENKGVDINRVVGAITNQRPDVVALQELDRNTTRSGKRDILQELAEATGMVGSYGPAIPFQGGEYGVAVLSKEKPVKSYNIPLPGKEEKRTLLVCEFERYVLFCVHLSLTEESRNESAVLINQERAKFAKPVIVAGDFNAGPGSELMLDFMRRWRLISPIEPTYPANKPSAIIDYIFIGNTSRVDCRRNAVLEEPTASDHRPVFTIVSFQ